MPLYPHASFIDAAGREAHADIWPDARQILEWQEQEPGYSGYRGRLRTFTENRSPDWHQRFGDPELLSRDTMII
jgi:hypothetical protein